MQRLRYLKIKVNWIYPSVRDRCPYADETLAHLLWFCPLLYNKLTAVFEWLSEAFSCGLQPDHNPAIFGYSAEALELPRGTTKGPALRNSGC